MKANRTTKTDKKRGGREMNICIDIDGTITTEDAWVKSAVKYFKKFISKEDITEYEIYKVLGVTPEEYDGFYKACGEKMHEKAPLRGQAKKVLKALNKKHQLYYVTAREEKMRNATEKWMRKNHLPNVPLHMTGSHYKVERAEALSCDVFIEDRYENAVQLALAGYQVILMDCLYNQKSILPNITRVKNWDEIEAIMRCFEEKKERGSVLFESKKRHLALFVS